MCHIASLTSKLDLLKKAREIEESEREREIIDAEKKKVLAQNQSKLDNVSLTAANEAMFLREEAVRRSLIEKMMQETPSSLGPVTNVLKDFEG